MTGRAPGKLVLCGEYTVLEGYPALAAACSRCAEAAWINGPAVPDPSDPDPSIPTGDSPSILPAGSTSDFSLRVAARGVTEGDWVLELSRDKRDRWHAEHLPAALDLLDVALQQLPGLRVPDAAGQQTLLLDTRAFCAASGDKLGLGSSAALLTALLRLLLFQTSRDGDEGVDEEALAGKVFTAHRAFQSGHGSGVDLAVALSGGVIRFRRQDGPEPAFSHAAVAWPSDLFARAVWTGHSASTGDALQRLSHFARSRASAYQDIMQRLGAATGQAIEAFSTGAVGDFMTLVDTLRSRLAALGELSGIDIVSAPHQRLAALAADQGVVYKPSGAGGGDCGIAFATDPQALAAFCQAAEAAGFQPLESDLLAPATAAGDRNAASSGKMDGSEGN